MAYAPLPEWEQVRKPKRMPKWWDEFESIQKAEAEKSREVTNRYDGLPGLQAVLCCLREANKPLQFRQIVKALDRKETSVAGWLHRLLESGNVIYEEHDRIRWWRLSSGEPTRSSDGTVHYGPIQRKILTLLRINPERWFTPQELQPLLGLSRVSRIIQSLRSLVRTGEVEQQFNATITPPRRHPYRYRWSEAK